MGVGILLCAFPKINTYATEEVTVNTEQVEATETETIETTEAAKVIEAAGAVVAPVTEDVAPKAEEAAKEEEQTEETKTEENNETSNIDKKTEEAKEVKEEKDAKEVKKAKAAVDSDKKAEAKAKEKKTEKKAEKKEEPKKKYSEADLRLLSAIIYCEAGSESYKGKVAVGIVVMNRVKSGSFPDTVKGVIYQSYQFSPVRNGSLDRALDQYDKGRFTSEDEKECIQAAKEVLSGKTTITLNGKEKDFSRYLFFSGRLKGHTLTLGNHQFK
jgi:spore germination cell wall hydrolase CwlJ-like protein